MENNNIKSLFIIFTFVLVGVQIASAIGISTPYHKSNPLEMYPGQEREVSFNLQNCPSLSETCEGGKIEVLVLIEEGGEIAEIVSGNEYKIPYGTADTNVILKMAIPVTVAVGTEYSVKFVIKPTPEDSGDTIQLGVDYTVEFPVIIKDQSEVTIVAPPKEVEQPKGDKSIIVLLGIGIVILLIILVILSEMFGKSKRRKK